MPTTPTQAVVAKRHDAKSLSINVLPPEVLVMIFIITQQLYHDKGEEYAWMKLLRVCTRWNNIFTETASLWSIVTMKGMHHMKHAQEILRRSGNVLLDVTIGNVRHEGDFDDGFFPAADKILGQMHRIRSLKVPLDDPRWKPVAFVKNSGTLKHLRGYMVPEDPYSGFDISSHWLLMDSLLSLQTLKLRINKTMTGVIHAPNLRKLELTLSVDNESGIRAPDLLETLRHMPLLENLALIWVVRWHEYFQHPYKPLSPTQINLPHLKKLVIKDRFEIPTLILQLLVIPAETCVTLSYQIYDTADMLTALEPLENILHVCTSSAHNPVHTLSIKNSVGGCSKRCRSLRFVGRAYAGKGTRGPKDICFEARIVISINYDISAVRRGEVGWQSLSGFNTVLNLLPKENMWALHIDGRDAVNSLRERMGLLSDDEIGSAEALEARVIRFGRGAHHDEFERAVQSEFPNLGFMRLKYSPLEEKFTLAGEIELSLSGNDDS